MLVRGARDGRVDSAPVPVTNGPTDHLHLGRKPDLRADEPRESAVWLVVRDRLSSVAVEMNPTRSHV